VIHLLFRRRGILLVCAALFFSLGASSCGSSNDQMTKPVSGTPETLFAEGKAAYAKEDWLDAIRIFEEVRIQAPTSSLAAEATYFGAMARFQQEMYSGAAVDFRSVRRNYPNSAFASRAQYMVGESYYQLSPRPELDQSYTTLAFGEYQAFLRDFPKAPQGLLDSAQHRLTEIRNKMSEKYYLSARLYDKLDDPKSALVYYNRILELYYDTPRAAEAQLRVAEINADRNKPDEVRKALDTFDGKYLQSASPEQRQRAMRLRASISSR